MAEPLDLRRTLGAAPIRRDVVRVQGPDAIAFVQGQLSQDVAALAIDESARSFLLQPTGKVDAWLRVTRLGEDEVLLDVDAGFGEAVRARLRRFRLRTDAELGAEEWAGLALRGPGAEDLPVPSGALALLAGWPTVEGVDLLSTGEIALAGVALASAGDLEALRIECGVPAMGAELTDATIPAEAGDWLIASSVSFTKGCYTGQELVARVDSRGGNVPHPIRGLVLSDGAVPVGAAVELDGKKLGIVTSSAHSVRHGPVALAVVGRAAEIGQQVQVRWSDGEASATITELPLP